LPYSSRGGEPGQDRKVAALSLAFVVGKAFFCPYSSSVERSHGKAER
jgi:hypothetical protein